MQSPAQGREAHDGPRALLDQGQEIAPIDALHHEPRASIDRDQLRGHRDIDHAGGGAHGRALALQLRHPFPVPHQPHDVGIRPGEDLRLPALANAFEVFQCRHNVASMPGSAAGRVDGPAAGTGRS